MRFDRPQTSSHVFWWTSSQMTLNCWTSGFMTRFCCTSSCTSFGLLVLDLHDIWFGGQQASWLWIAEPQTSWHDFTAPQATWHMICLSLIFMTCGLKDLSFHENCSDRPQVSWYVIWCISCIMTFDFLDLKQKHKYHMNIWHGNSDSCVALNCLSACAMN